MTESDYTAYRAAREQALVAFAFKDPATAIDEVLPYVGPSDFADPDLGEVYSVMRDLRDARFRIDMESVCLELQKRGVVDRIGRHSLRQMMHSEHSIANARQYALEVARLANHRRVTKAAEQVLAQQFDINADPAKLVEKFDSRAELQTSTRESATVAECVSQMLESHRQAKLTGSLGMKTGFESLDEVTSGMHPQQLWLIGARSNTGKTAFALSLCNSLASGATGKKRGVVFFSMEMTKTEIAERICSDELGINYGRFNHTDLSEHHFQQIESSIPNFASWPYVISDRPSQSVSEIKAKARIYAPKSGLDCIVVDTLQRVRPRIRQERRLELQCISNELKDVAKELNCCVIVCTQLNSNAENREPDLTHLSEGKQIIEPVDTCLLLHRPDRDEPRVIVKAEKLRRGRRQDFEMNFAGKFQRFTDAGSAPVEFISDFQQYNRPL